MSGPSIADEGLSKLGLFLRLLLRNPTQRSLGGQRSIHASLAGEFVSRSWPGFA